MNTYTTTVPRQILEDALQVAELDPDEALREDYSGRFMYGDTCLGIVCDVPQFALFCAALGATADDWDFVGRVRSDSMGLSSIFYFPGVGIWEDDDD